MKTNLLIFVWSVFFAFSSNAITNDYNTKSPVEIEADELEVEQESQKATFIGNVTAKQDNIKINSDRMLVFYKTVKDDIGKSQNTVSKVETVGNVVLQTPKEKANSKRGVFDVENKIITLLGNVSLSSGKNVVKGEKFVYNLKTGKSRIVSDEQQGADGKKKKQRVRGVFVPE